MSYPPNQPPWQPDPNQGTPPPGWQPPPGTPAPGGPQSMAPGWYPDPMQAGHQRQWDGQQWVGPSIPAGGGGTPPKKGGFPRWLIPVIACLALGLIAVIGGALASSSDDDSENAVADRETTTTVEEQDEEDPTTTEAEEEEEEATTTEATTTTASTTTAPPEPDGSQNRPLPIGGTSRVGDYDVTVTAINLAATEAVQSQNQFNEPPTNGQYALASVRVVYVGNEEGSPGFDIGLTLQGGNGVQYDDFSCNATLGDRARFNAPTLTNGGTAEFDVCMDIPADAAPGSSFFVDDAFSFDDGGRKYWVTG